MVSCPACGQETPSGFPRCANCGAELAAPEPLRQERKVVTVLFCDLVGFTSRAERMDPEDVRSLLAPYHAHVRSELERFGGTVEKFIGDAVMAVFGAPVAHEDDPERAIRAALAIRDWAAEEGIELRIGVNTGEALVAIGGEPLATGDVVNTAARLQAAAPSGGVLAGETTYRATRDWIAYEPRQPVAAKGKSAPVPVWEAAEALSRLGVDTAGAGAPLVGREHELDLLADALARVREARRAQLVTIVGVPGIGKSRLVYELMQAAERDPEFITWRQGRSLPYGDGVTYWALAEMVKAQAGILETDPPGEADRKLADAVAHLLPDPAEAQRVAAWLRPLAGLETERELGGDRRAESFAAWRRFFEALAERPAVLVFEDLHWADENLLDFVDHLVDWVTDVPLLCVCTARPELYERRPAWAGGKANAAAISLAPLSDDQTARLLGALLERPVLPAGQQAALLARAGGNPLYAEQFARMLAERGDAGELPETVQGIIAARLDALPPEDKGLLQDAAVLGKVFWAGALAAMEGRDRAAVDERLHALERKEFVRRERRPSLAGESEYAFRHLLVRDVAYAQIPRGLRAEKHRAVAEWIESVGRAEDYAELLAHHWAEALEYARAAGAETAGLELRARTALRDAGDRALALSAFGAAARFYERALALWPDDDERPALVVSYGRSRADDPSSDPDLLESAAAQLLRLGDRELAAEAEALVAFVWWHRGVPERALRHLERARAAVAPAGPSPAKAFVLSQLSRFSMLTGENERAIEVSTEALAMAEELGLDELRAHNLNNMGVARVGLGEGKRGLADLERAIEVAAGLNTGEHYRAALNRATMTLFLGDVRRAQQLHEENVRIAAALGLNAYVLWERAEDVWYAYATGRWDESARGADAFLAQVAASGASHYMTSQCLEVRALIRLARGDVDGALADSATALEQVRGIGDPQMLDPVLAIRARLLVETGREDEADEVAGELLALVTEDPARLSPARVDLAWALRGLGREAELAEAVAGIRDHSRWFEAAWRIAVGRLSDAADELEAIGSVADEAFARLQSGTPTDLERALAFYRSVGATRYVREAEQLLEAPAV